MRYEIFNIIKAQKVEIIDAFQPITERNRLPLEDEISQNDRVNFEQILFSIYGIVEHYQAIKESLLHLYKIRFAVKT